MAGAWHETTETSFQQRINAEDPDFADDAVIHSVDNDRVFELSWKN